MLVVLRLRSKATTFIMRRICKTQSVPRNTGELRAGRNLRSIGSCKMGNLRHARRCEQGASSLCQGRRRRNPGGESAAGGAAASLTLAYTGQSTIDFRAMVSTARGSRWSQGRQLANLTWRLDGAGLSWWTASGDEVAVTSFQDATTILR
jgi:hypothetical protein